MIPYTAVNNGIAFSTYEVFTSADANALRTNSEAAWASLMRSWSTADIDLDAAEYENGSALSGFGTAIWSDFYRAFVSASLPNGSSGSGFYAVLPPGGPLHVVEDGTPPTGAAATPPILLTLNDDSVTTALLVLVYSESAAGKTGIAINPGLQSTWSKIYYDGTALAVYRGAVESVAATVGTYPAAVIGGTDVTSAQSTLLVVRPNASPEIVASTFLGTHSGAGISSLASDGSQYVLGTPTSAACAYGMLYNAAANTAADVSMPWHADADPTARRVAYDPRTSRFVYMMMGLYTGARAGQLMWTTSALPATWSATTDWMIAQLATIPYAGLGSYSLEDFAITGDGLWVVLLKDARQFAITDTYHCIISADSGANWNFTGAWVQPSTSTRPMLAKSGQGFAIVQSKTATASTLMVSGAVFSPTAIVSSAI